MDDPELQAMAAISLALGPLDEDARIRVMSWSQARFGGRGPQAASAPLRRSDELVEPEARRSAIPQATELSFAEFFADCRFESEADKALIAAVWLQDHEGYEKFGSQELNSRLKDLGHGITNVTRELGKLISERPQLVLQTRKHGTTKQARKEYRVTEAGRKRVAYHLKASTQQDDDLTS